MFAPCVPVCDFASAHALAAFEGIKTNYDSFVFQCSVFIMLHSPSSSIVSMCLLWCHWSHPWIAQECHRIGSQLTTSFRPALHKHETNHPDSAHIKMTVEVHHTLTDIEQCKQSWQYWQYWLAWHWLDGRRLAADRFCSESRWHWTVQGWHQEIWSNTKPEEFASLKYDVCRCMCKHIVSITYVILHAICMRVRDIYKANSWYILLAAIPLYIYALKGHISTALLLLPCCPCRPFQVQGHLRRIFVWGFRAEHMQELTTSHSNIYVLLLFAPRFTQSLKFIQVWVNVDLLQCFHRIVADCICVWLLARQPWIVDYNFTSYALGTKNLKKLLPANASACRVCFYDVCCHCFALNRWKIC